MQVDCRNYSSPASGCAKRSLMQDWQTLSVQTWILFACLNNLAGDSHFDCLVMGQILTQAGCQFSNIRDPLQALPILIEHKPDLIFLDLYMPVMNGYEICVHIRRVLMFKETPVIIVTSSDGLVDRVRAKLIGATGFIAKPIEPEKVLTTLQQHLVLF